MKSSSGHGSCAPNRMLVDCLLCKNVPLVLRHVMPAEDEGEENKNSVAACLTSLFLWAKEKGRVSLSPSLLFSASEARTKGRRERAERSKERKERRQRVGGNRKGKPNPGIKQKAAKKGMNRVRVANEMRGCM